MINVGMQMNRSNYEQFTVNLETKPGLLVINSYLNQINPDLKDVQSEIREVVGKQKSLIDAMLKENEELSNLLNESEVQNMFSSIKHCHGQLVELKKKLMFLHKKTMTLEKRANVLRVAKQREALQREHQKESMLVREQELISKQT
ncbi:biogenesis of lysosome-related organelles complex 1 subunit 6-like isoform X2 [Myzus persicae]|uniref:biogenesis of lysosome-related organelles complex 1 subunit 6-like isoform X2 n=1 Tax=Myzus persicae TaxID=13164 RepID=UPI000B939621|nr:biogenesis of lysosome-related organelles complex 1 subunit 6-like isoform X2 [Myzus persicae]